MSTKMFGRSEDERLPLQSLHSHENAAPSEYGRKKGAAEITAAQSSPRNSLLGDRLRTLANHLSNDIGNGPHLIVATTNERSNCYLQWRTKR